MDILLGAGVALICLLIGWYLGATTFRPEVSTKVAKSLGRLVAAPDDEVGIVRRLSPAERERADKSSPLSKTFKAMEDDLDKVFKP